MQELAWLVLHDGDTALAQQSPIFSRVPILELTAAGAGQSGMDLAEDVSGPKVAKTHLPLKFYRKQMAEAKDLKEIVSFLRVFIDFL